MAEKKYLDLTGLSNFLDNIRSLFANKAHTHKVSDITDFSDNDTTYTLSKSGSTITLTGSDGNNTSVTETTYSDATQSTSGLMSKSDKTKLDGITEGAEVNQNAFSNVVVGTTTIAADGKTDSLTLTAGSNVTLTPDAVNDSITIDAKDTTYNASTTSVAGLMSADDKKKLDGIATGANNYVLPVAGSDIGGVKSGTDITVDSSGNVSVNNDSHTHGEDTITSVKASVITGTISETNLPSYVDDVVEYSAKSSFPDTGESGKIYVDTATNLTYRWSGSGYVEISPSIALGETPSTAYRGDYGAAAYAHAVTNKGSAFNSGLYKIATNSEGHVTDAADVSKSDIASLGITASVVATTSGDGSAYTATVEGINSLTAGATFIMVPHTVSTSTSPTLNVNGLGAKSIRQPLSNSTSSTTSAANTNWLGANKPIKVTYNGTFWVADLVRPNASTLYGTLAIDKGGTGANNAADARVNLGITTADGTTISGNADYAEVGEWADSNTSCEDRIGYFVAIDDATSGKTMVKATPTSDVRGVTVAAPAFSGNCSSDKFDENGSLLKQYDYVAVMGLVSVIDNGTCTINGRCMPTDDGTAVPSPNNMGYQVIDRIDDTHILVAVEPSADMLVRIKEDVEELQAIEIGGRNLLYDSGLKSYTRSNAENDYLAEGAPIWYISDYGAYVLPKGGEFTLSGFYTITGITTACDMSLVLRSSSDTFDTNGLIIPLSVGDNSGRFKFTFTPSDLQKQYCDGWMIYGLGAGANEGAVFEFERVKLEKGNKATDWTPSFESISDDYSRIATLSRNGRMSAHDKNRLDNFIVASIDDSVDRFLLSNAVVWSKYSLPSAYKEVAYIESTGTQYIDTGFKLNQDSRVAIVFKGASEWSNAWYQLFGNEDNTLASYNPNQAGYYLQYGNTSTYQYIWNVGFDGVYTIDFDANVVSNSPLAFNDKKSVTFDVSTFQASSTCWLFNANGIDNATYPPAKMRLYACKIYDNGTLVRDFVPCVRNSDSVAGLYDVVNDTFYINAGTGSFTYPATAESQSGYSYGTDDLIAGTSELATGKLYFVYE